MIGQSMGKLFVAFVCFSGGFGLWFCVRVCVRVRERACMHACVCVCAHVCACIHACIMHGCAWVHACVCTHASIYTPVCANACVHVRACFLYSHVCTPKFFLVLLTIAALLTHPTNQACSPFVGTPGSDDPWRFVHWWWVRDPLRMGGSTELEFRLP